VLFSVQCGTCPVCRQSLTAAVNADTEMPSSSSSEEDAEVGRLQENTPVVPVDMETVADDEVPVLSPNSVIDDVEFFETDARL